MNISIIFILPAEPCLVSMNEEEKRQLCLNRIKPSRSPQLKLLFYLILFILVKEVYIRVQVSIDW